MTNDLIHLARMCNYVAWRKVRYSTGRQRLWWLAVYHRLFLRMQARGIINGYLIIDIENGRAVNIREVRTRHHSLTSRSSDEEE